MLLSWKCNVDTHCNTALSKWNTLSSARPTPDKLHSSVLIPVGALISQRNTTPSWNLTLPCNVYCLLALSCASHISCFHALQVCIVRKSHSYTGQVRSAAFQSFKVKESICTVLFKDVQLCLCSAQCSEWTVDIWYYDIGLCCLLPHCTVLQSSVASFAIFLTQLV